MEITRPSTKRLQMRGETSEEERKVAEYEIKKGVRVVMTAKVRYGYAVSKAE